MPPFPEKVSLVRFAEMERRFGEIQVARTNHQMRQEIYEKLVEWARTKPPAFPAWELVEAIADTIATYATSIGAAGQISFGFLLPGLLPQIVSAMIDDADERHAILDGVYAVFVPEPPPAA